MRVVVDYDQCESNGKCEEILPQVFQVAEEDDRLRLLQERPGEELRAQVEEAVKRCPKMALSLEDE
ncbi:MAG TPA: ferredoxin [Actinomycetota bacterium]|nr:ferredoxin [Actinomycetota bacterium]